jgi:hypothetical protein
MKDKTSIPKANAVAKGAGAAQRVHMTIPMDTPNPTSRKIIPATNAV